MPEGDVVSRVATRLDQAMRGQQLTRCEFRVPRFATVDLTGSVVVSTVARGKHLLTRLDRGTGTATTLHTHLRTDGSWRLFRTAGAGSRNDPAGDHGSDPTLGHGVRVVLGTTQWLAVGLRLGVVELLPTAEEMRAVGHLGPDLLGLDWDLRVAVANVMAVPERSLGAALLDQRNLAGIGTFYLSETAFLRGVNPWRTVGELGTREVTEVITLAQRLMRANLTGAGQSTTGSTRRGHESYVHPRSGRSCRRCRTTIRVAMLGDPPLDRAVFFCPGCQPGPVPTDDGRPQRPLGSAPKRTRGDGRLRRPPGR